MVLGKKAWGLYSEVYGIQFMEVLFSGILYKGVGVIFKLSTFFPNVLLLPAGGSPLYTRTSVWPAVNGDS